jgi:hypothetical protein
MSKTKRWIEKQEEDGNYTLFNKFGAYELWQQEQQQQEAEHTPNLIHQKKESDEEE